ncbi:hypothetical protein APHAL10511_007244 [Amanita phalloides]|nr:hypothetical protein APHAL10511_007244 [Amanita phalloides]
MFGLIRRLSHSVIPRPDRPWEDDPTSNAPHKPRKRRLSTSEQEDANSDRCTHAGRTDYAGGSATKRARGESVLSTGDVDEFGGLSESVPPPQSEREQEPSPPSSAVEPRPEQVETQEVKDMTQGVKEVELEDKDSNSGDPAKEVEPESVPLPDEDEVDELADDDKDEM